MRAANEARPEEKKEKIFSAAVSLSFSPQLVLRALFVPRRQASEEDSPMEASKRQRVDDQMEVEEPAAVVKPSGNLEEHFSEDLLRLCAAEPAPHRPPPS